MALVVLLRGVNTFDRLFGVPVTTRNWNTITAITRVLGNVSLWNFPSS